MPVLSAVKTKHYFPILINIRSAVADVNRVRVYFQFHSSQMQLKRAVRDVIIYIQYERTIIDRLARLEIKIPFHFSLM